MVKVNHIDHVAIAVSDATEATARLAGLFGLRAGALEHVAAQKADVVFLQAGQSPTAVELVCPSGNESLERFLDKRGPGLHHICFDVSDLAQALAQLKAAGVPLIDETPRLGARGHMVAFLHPKATGGVLFELCQKSEGNSP
jgi:methylmalonyl-CoA/ethylmalonyl-CoA epimerase